MGKKVKGKRPTGWTASALVFVSGATEVASFYFCLTCLGREETQKREARESLFPESRRNT